MQLRVSIDFSSQLIEAGKESGLFRQSPQLERELQTPESFPSSLKGLDPVGFTTQVFKYSG